MSADLLDLDDFYKHQPNNDIDQIVTGGYAGKSLNGSDHVYGSATTVNDADDEFGDFESAARQGGQDSVNTPKLELETQNAITSGAGFKEPSPSIEDIPETSAKQRDANVLFDAEDESDADFGDFERAQPGEGSRTQRNVAPATAQRQVETLIDIEDDTAASMASPRTIGAQTSTTFVPQQASFKKRLVPLKNKQSCSAPNTSDSTVDAVWEDFPETVPRTPGVKATANNHVQTLEGSKSQRLAAKTSNPGADLYLQPLLPLDTESEDDAPPSNIPPPALILPAITPIISRVHETFLGPLGQLSVGDKTSVLASLDTKAFLISVLKIAAVLGHVIGGRKLRWKRDTRLAQSMRIGPASSSGKSGGMKLTGVDKAESSREDREVGDILKTWRLHVGKVRSVVSTAGIETAVPELADAPVIRTAQASKGAISSLKPCALCGIKRNERVMKVDTDVQDSFGEWWIEHWGHKDCRNFWSMYEQDLRTR